MTWGPHSGGPCVCLTVCRSYRMDIRPTIPEPVAEGEDQKYPLHVSKPVRPPDVAEMRAFCAAVDLGSFGKAARLLHLSQPALSKRIQTLEELAGVRLLNRSPRGVEPTPAGTKLYPEARKMLVQAEMVEGMMGGLSADDIPVRLAVSHTVAEFILPAKLVEFELKHQHHLSVELVIANSAVVRDLVRGGRAEIGIAATEPGRSVTDGLKEIPFCDDEVVVAVPEKHAWAGAKEIELCDFLRTPLIVRDPDASTRRTVEAVLGEKDFKLAPPLAEVGSTSAAKSTALKECVPLLISRCAMGDGSEGFVVHSVEGLSFPRQFVLLLAGEESISPSARSLISHLVDS